MVWSLWPLMITLLHWCIANSCTGQTERWAQCKRRPKRIDSIRIMEITCKPLQQQGKQWHAVKDAQDKQHVSLNLLEQSLSNPGMWTGACPWRNACRSAEYLSWICLGGYLVHGIYLTLALGPLAKYSNTKYTHTQASPAPQSACSLAVSRLDSSCSFCILIIEFRHVMDLHLHLNVSTLSTLCPDSLDWNASMHSANSGTG